MDHLVDLKEEEALIVQLSDVGLSRDFRLLQQLYTKAQLKKELAKLSSVKRPSYRPVSTTCGIYLSKKGRGKYRPHPKFEDNGVYFTRVKETYRNAVTGGRKILFALSDEFASESGLIPKDEAQPIAEFIKKMRQAMLLFLLNLHKFYLLD